MRVASRVRYDLADRGRKWLVRARAIIRGQREPGGEVRFGLPRRHVQTDFADDGLGHADVDARFDDEKAELGGLFVEETCCSRN
jgi:hypothetical protein